MSALQVRWLNNHFAQGKISKEEFASLHSLIAHSEAEAQQSIGVVKSKGVPRLHPMTRRTLAQVRLFRTLAKVVNYLLVIAFVSVIYLVAENYQITGTLPAFNLEGLEKVLTQTPRKPLPSDIMLAAEALSGDSGWYNEHINQFASQWQALDQRQQQQYQRTRWFKTFQLSLSLQIFEQRALAKQGNKKAMQQALALTNLSKQIEKSTS